MDQTPKIIFYEICQILISFLKHAIVTFYKWVPSCKQNLIFFNTGERKQKDIFWIR